MNEILAFNTQKLNELSTTLNSFYQEYKEIISSLDLEINRLGKVWNTNDSTIYNAYKEKFDEKKSKLIEVERMLEELNSQLGLKKSEMEEATRNTINNFE